MESNKYNMDSVMYSGLNASVSANEGTKIVKLNEYVVEPESEPDPLFDQWLVIISLIGIVIFGTGFMYLSIMFFEKCCLRRIKRIIAPIELDQADLI